MNNSLIVPWKLVLVLLIMCGGSFSCKRKFIREVIERENCLKKTVLNFICIGSCHQRESEHSQCSITIVRQKIVRLWCTNENGSIVRKNVTIPIPASCSCTQRSLDYVYMPLTR